MRWIPKCAAAGIAVVSAILLPTASASAAGASARSAPPGLPARLQAAAQPAQTANPGQGPVGWDSYRHLDQLPNLPVGVQTQQFASTDPNGQNGDFNHTLGRAGDGSFVLAQRGGPGEIDAIWTTSNGGDVTQTGNIRVILDGQVVLNAPEQDVVNGALGAPFTFPLVANANQTSGGAYIDVPMPYRSSMLVTTTNDPVYYHVDYRSYADPTGVATFNPHDAANDVVSQFSGAGTQDPKGSQAGQVTTAAAIAALPGQTDTLGTFQGSARINALQLTLPQLGLPAVATPAPSAAKVATGPTNLVINPNNNGVRVTRRLVSGAGTEADELRIGGNTVATLAPTPPGAKSGAHWAAQNVNLPSSVTAGHSTIQIAPTASSGSRFAYQVTDLPSQNAAAATSAANDVFQNVRLRITFDGQQTVDAPLGQFFGSALGEAQVKSLMVAVNTQTNTLSAWWPMPYAQQATVAVYNGSQQTLAGGTAQVTTAPVSGEAEALGPSGQDGYFHATADFQSTVANQNYPFLSTGGWGKFVGISEAMQGLVPANPENYLEGNEQAFVDGSPTPQINGTGTEDLYQGGWYFNRGTFSDPLNGNPAQQYTGACQYRCDSTYRLMLADAVPFSSSLDFGIQHGRVNTTPSNYASTAYWYGRSGASPALYRALPLDNGWSQAPGANPPSYVVEGAYTRLLGGVAGGAAGQPMATLPPNLAPSADEWFSVVTARNVVAPLVVHPDGTIVLQGGNPGFVSLSGIVLDVARSTAYQPLALENGWTGAQATYPPGWSPGYVQNGSYVELTGGLNGGIVGQPVAILPGNLRPPADEWFSVVTANGVVGTLVVHPDGTIVLHAGNPGFLSLSGIGVMVGSSPPSNLTLQNGWSPAPGTNPPGFTQEGKEVDLRGGIVGGSTGQTIATLPSGSRPAADESFVAVTAGDIVAAVAVHPDGTIVLAGGNPGFLSLEDLRVSSDAVSPIAITAPGAPTIGQATGGNASAAVTFAPPSSDGGSPVTSYTATATDQTNPAHGGQTAKGGASPLTVTGLTNGDSYTFTVTATNAVGTGPPSAPSSSVTPVAPPPPTPEPYHPLTAARITDTRPSSGEPNAGMTLGPGATLNVQVTGAGGIPGTGVSAAVLNVTATNPTQQSYLTVWPTAAPQPTASNLNFAPGQTVANLAEVGVGTAGQVSIYNPAGSVDVVVDVEGYVGPSAPAGAGLYNPLTPARITDTRSGSGEPNAGARLGPGATLDVQVTGAGGVPAAGVEAAVLNVTATNPTQPSYLTVWPTGAPQPTASNLNFGPGQTVPNRAMVPVGTNGKVSIYNPAGSVDVVVDVGGYFTDSSDPMATGAQFTPTAPTRITDTRSGSGFPNAGKTLGPNGTLPVQVSGTGGVPAEGLSAAVMNVTVTNTTKSSFLTVWPTKTTQATASDLNWFAGQTVPNLVVVKLGSDGAVQVFNAAGSVDVVVDVSGWYS